MVGIEYGSSSAEQLGDSGDHGGSRGGTGGANSGAGADDQRREAAAERAAGGRDAAEWRRARRHMCGGLAAAERSRASLSAGAGGALRVSRCVCMVGQVLSEFRGRVGANKGSFKGYPPVICMSFSRWREWLATAPYMMCIACRGRGAAFSAL